jgi:hypothetical protein
MRDPDQFARVASDWAVTYAGAPRTDGQGNLDPVFSSKSRPKKSEEIDIAR